MLKLPRLGYAEAVSALKNRHCYASNGPLIHALYVEDGTLYVECSPAAKLFLHGCGRRTGVVLAEPGRPLSRAAFLLKGSEPFVWLEVRDEAGRFAASSAYFAEELQGRA